MDFEAWVKAKGFNCADMTGEQTDAMKALYKAETDTNAAKPKPDGSDDPEDPDTRTMTTRRTRRR